MLKRIFSIILFASIMVWVPSVQAADQPSENQLKAAYLYNYTKFVSWPDHAFVNAESPFIIGVIGSENISKNLKLLAKKSVRNRSMKVQLFKSVIAAKDNCHLLYFTESKRKNLKSELKSLNGSSILTVSNIDNFAELGGIIQFVTVRGRLRFIINLEEAKASGLKVDAQLLSLAIEVLEAAK